MVFHSQYDDVTYVTYDVTYDVTYVYGRYRWYSTLRNPTA